MNDPERSTSTSATAAVAAVDWAATSLGSRDQWSLQLRTAADLVLSTRFPMFLAWGQALCILYNDAFSAVIGPAHPEAMGESLSRLWQKDWPLVGPVFARTMGGESIYYENAAFRIDHGADEEMRYFTFSQTPVRAAPGEKPIGLIAICIDTTEEVRNRQRLAWANIDLEDIFQNAPGFIGMTLGPEHRFEFINETYSQMIGGRDVIGKTVREALPEIVPQGYLDLLDHIYQTGEPFTASEMPIKLLDENGNLQQKFVAIILKAFRDAEGAVVGVFAEGYDVTDRKAASESIDALQRSLHHASQVAAMGTMAATLAHELNQPLAAAANYVRGSTRLVEQLTGDRKDLAKTGLAEAEQQILRAGEIIRRVRGGVAGSAMRREPVSLKEVAARALKVIKASGTCPRVQISTNFARSADKVQGDAVQLEQVLLNLVRNACQAAAVDEGCVEILSRQSDKPEFVEVEVRDNGPGVASDPATLFDSFGTSTSGGLGVGLSITRTIIEAHGGKLWARNGSTGGASFYFTVLRDA
ncbi:MAG TPA: ATP-binding protein [Allosphingosinicella sp.]|nr:ATP-binding protein [Allosphingosinicella sp.]